MINIQDGFLIKRLSKSHTCTPHFSIPLVFFKPYFLLSGKDFMVKKSNLCPTLKINLPAQRQLLKH